MAGEVLQKCANEESPRLGRQVQFLLTLDRLKTIERRNRIAGGTRRENSAEHSWHVAVAAMILAEHADAPVRVERVLQMLLLHDVVEILAGDSFCYSPTPDQSGREHAAADELFGQLPEDQRERFLTLWHEYESGDGHDAAFARAIDRLQPLFLNIANSGGTWRENDVRLSQVLKRKGPIAKASRVLWNFTERTLKAAVGAALLRE